MASSTVSSTRIIYLRSYNPPVSSIYGMQMNRQIKIQQNSLMKSRSINYFMYLITEYLTALLAYNEIKHIS
jgi:hypothetical protein